MSNVPSAGNRLAQYIKAQVLSLQRSPRPHSSAHHSQQTRSLLVEKVAPVSIAATAGIGVGDVLLEVEGIPAGDVDFDLLPDRKREKVRPTRIAKPTTALLLFQALLDGFHGAFSLPLNEEI